MIGASKILTVSYGTFSCTLEGFDEPFNTMKAIAEYFRDLAAEDRYFGAEPPTPDAAMLHRIAEREIQRRVEAKINEHGVILRAGEPETVALVPPVAVPSVAAAPVADASGESVAARLSRLRALQAEPAAQPILPQTVVVPDTAPVLPKAHDAYDDVAAADLAPEVYSEDQHADDILANLAGLTDVEASQPAQMEVPDLDGAALDELIAAEPVAPADSSETSVELTVQDTMIVPEDPVLVATDLADASENSIPVTIYNLADSIEDDFETDYAAPEIEAVSADILPEDAVDASAEALPEAAIAIDADDDLLASVGSLIEEADQPADTTLTADLAAATPVETYDDSYEDLVSEVQLDDAALDEAFETEVARFDIVDAVEVVEPEAEHHVEPVAAAAEEPTEQDQPNADAARKLQRARARVIKIRRAEAPVEPVEPAGQTSVLSPEAEAALQAELSALQAETTPVADVSPRPIRPVRPVRPIVARQAAAVEETPVVVEPEVAEAAAVIEIESDALDLDDEDEDLRLHAAVNAAFEPESQTNDLDAAVAALMATDNQPEVETAVEVETASDAEDLYPAEADAPALHTEGRRILEGESGEDAVNRLIAQTNSAMDGEENRRRHAAITHLKAAVAATEAERQINAANPGKAAADRQDAYRHDLESVVRTHPSDARANGERPAPLVLVSEQRIDRKPAPAHVAPLSAVVTAPAEVEIAPRVVMPVRPRRIVVSAAPMSAARAEDTLIGNADDDYDDEDGIDDDVNLFADGQSFADFAEKLGANTLPELLEASAVYCAQVLGRPQFSRPMVLRQVSAMTDAPDHSREDSLRVFGTLLRQGRIAKIKRGQFAVTDRSPILAEALRTAG